MTYTNLRNVISITVYKESENLLWEYLKPLKERRIFFGLIRISKARPEGWFPKVDWEFSNVRTLQEILDGDNSVYYNGVKLMNKSVIYVKCINGSFKRYFDTYQAACDYTREITKNYPDLVKFD